MEKEMVKEKNIMIMEYSVSQVDNSTNLEETEKEKNITMIMITTSMEN